MYYLEIETDQYAGNFEREMCALLAIKYGDCGVGDDIVEYECSLLDDDLIDEIQDSIGVRQDSRGCYRPVFMCGPSNKSIRIVIDSPSDEVMSFIGDRVKNFKELLANRIANTSDYCKRSYQTMSHVNILSAKLICEQIVVTESVVEEIL